MREIYIHHYVLESPAPANRLAGRREFQGALVRIGSGFGCIHPWPELGDLPLDGQLSLLGAGKCPTPLLKRTLECARLDGEARESGTSLFNGLEIPESHWLWNSGINTTIQKSSLLASRFRAVKVKCDGSPGDRRLLEELLDGLPAHVRLRPDLNGALDGESAAGWFGNLPEWVRERIDFVEDPMAFDADEWRKLASEFEIDLALDRAGEKGPIAAGGYRWRVIKPAVDNPAKVADSQTGAGLIFTSYLDHPLGQVFAAFCAAQAAKHPGYEMGLCGLATHLWFGRNDFSEALEVGNGGRLETPEGTGLGFNDLLESLPWKKL